MYKLITAPTVEPISVTELKSQLRITGTSQDTMLGVLAKAARQHVEDYLRYSLMTATWELYLDSFPKSGDCIWIQKSPVTEITFLKYYNTEGTLTELSLNTDYIPDFNSKPCRIYEAYSKQWPAARVIPNAVIVKFKAGYETAAAVPDLIRQAILMVATTMYENPSDEVTGTQVNTIEANSLHFLKPLRAMRF